MKKSIRLALISAGLLSAFGMFSTSVNAAKITVALAGQGMSLKCSAGYAAKGYACPTIAGPAPSCPADTYGAWVGVPSMTIPTNASGGTMTVPGFCVMKYIAGRQFGVGSIAVSEGSNPPYVSVRWDDAQTACQGAGGRLMRDSEWMALAHNLVNVDANWGGGLVDSGNVKDGLQNNEVSSVTSAFGASALGRDRRLNTGEVIWDIGGNAWQFTYHDMAGNSSGRYGLLPLSQRTVPYGTRTAGVGAYPSVEAYTDGSSVWNAGSVPARGGSFVSANGAGPFALTDSPIGGNAITGFRCTK